MIVFTPTHEAVSNRRFECLAGILHKVRVSPQRIGRLAKAIHVLQNYEATAG